MENELTIQEMLRLDAERDLLRTKERLRGRPKKPGGPKERVVLYVEPVTARALEALATKRNTTVAELLVVLAKVATRA